MLIGYSKVRLDLSIEYAHAGRQNDTESLLCRDHRFSKRVDRASICAGAGAGLWADAGASAGCGESAALEVSAASCGRMPGIRDESARGGSCGAVRICLYGD